MKILKIIGSLFAGILLIAVLAYLLIEHNIATRLDKVYNFPGDSLTLTSDPVMLDRGRHLVAIKGCADCHNTDLGGKLFLDDPTLGKISASNLTRGKGGLPASYGVTDWIMALRHGINREHRALWIMPSQETAALSDEDLRALIAYCRQLPPIDRDLPANKLKPLIKVLTYFDQMPLFPVEKIRHQQKTLTSTHKLDAVGMGQYLSVSCIGCHRDNLRGGKSPIPGMPVVPDITSSGAPGKWTEMQFRSVLRTGLTPSGHQMDNRHMPWKMTANYTDQEISSVYMYLRTLK
jgi:mono/diheme cytochrome c family protein